MTATRTIEDYVNLERCVDALEDELIKVRKDAARYQWLRRQPWVKTKCIHAWGDLLDSAIDEVRNDSPTELAARYALPKCSGCGGLIHFGACSKALHESIVGADTTAT